MQVHDHELLKAAGCWYQISRRIGQNLHPESGADMGSPVSVVVCLIGQTKTQNCPAHPNSSTEVRLQQQRWSSKPLRRMKQGTTTSENENMLQMSLASHAVDSQGQGWTNTKTSWQTLALV